MGWGVRVILLFWAVVYSAPVFSAEDAFCGPAGVGYSFLSEKARKAALVAHYKQQQFAEGKRPVSTSEGSLLYDWHRYIVPFILSKRVSGEFTGVGGVPIHYSKYLNPNEKGAVVISHGFSENETYYWETIYNLYERGYSVYILDHRGHGLSGRQTATNRPVYVDKFQHYVDDLKTFIDSVVHQTPHKQVTLLGHSMGGLISSLYAAQNEGKIDRLVLSAPLFAPNTHGLPLSVAENLSKLIRLLGWGKSYAFGQSEDPIAFNRGFGANPLTSSRNRFLKKLQLFAAEVDLDIANNGATFGWVAEAVAACRQGRCSANNIKVPVMLFTGGQDGVVQNAYTSSFAGKLPNVRTQHYGAPSMISSTSGTKSATSS